MQGDAERIEWDGERLVVPQRPAVPFIAGDGIGEEIWRATRRVLDAAIEERAPGRSIAWVEHTAGQAAVDRGLEPLPDSTLEAIRAHRVAIKGPTTTPVGRGHRSVNVALRQKLGLFASIRPVRHFEGVLAPVRDPGALDVVIFRENTEDVYSGIEFPAGSDGARRIESLLGELGHALPPGSGIGLKPISRGATRRIVAAALEYALAHGRRRLTLVHKGNIMKHTEGAFLEWGLEIVRERFGGRAVVLSDLPPGGSPPPDRILVGDRIADAMFQDLLLRPRELDVLVAPNLNGDYLSDACAACVGGLGLAPGANVGEGRALFEATHGTAPDIAGRGVANPGSLVLSGAMLLEFLGWREAACAVTRSLETVLGSGRMTVDLAAGRGDVQVLGTDAFADALVEAIRAEG